MKSTWGTAPGRLMVSLGILVRFHLTVSGECAKIATKARHLPGQWSISSKHTTTHLASVSACAADPLCVRSFLKTTARRDRSYPRFTLVFTRVLVRALGDLRVLVRALVIRFLVIRFLGDLRTGALVRALVRDPDNPIPNNATRPRVNRSDCPD